jgi:F-type H+-transporting ATPase subunit b
VDAGETPVISLNATLVVQLINFVVLLVILNAILYKPILAKLREREARIKADRDKAEELNRQVEEQEDRHQQELAKARQTAAQEKTALMDEAKKKESEILATARGESAKILDTMKASIESEAEEVRKTLRAEMTPLAQSIAVKILGRAV